MAVYTFRFMWEGSSTHLVLFASAKSERETRREIYRFISKRNHVQRHPFVLVVSTLLTGIHSHDRLKYQVPQHRPAACSHSSEPLTTRTCKHWRRSWAKKFVSSILTKSRSGPPSWPHPTRGHRRRRKVDTMSKGVDPSWCCWGISTTERQPSSMRSWDQAAVSRSESSYVCASQCGTRDRCRTKHTTCRMLLVDVTVQEKEHHQ